MTSADSVRQRIEHEVAELRASHPHLSACESALVQWSENGAPRYSLHLDIRWPNHQTLLSGPAHDSAEAAIAAGFHAARERLQQATWASR